jgi:glycogen(starch) synthase
VRLLGHLSTTAMAQSLGHASIFAHPAKYEPFGLSVLEAARSSCALVLADIASMRELWDHCAFFVAPDDVQGWQDCLDLLIRNPRIRRELAARAFRRSRDFRLEDSAGRYIQLYSTMLDARSPALESCCEAITAQ